MPLRSAFLDAIRAQQAKDYVVLLDCSSAMSPAHWNSARKALAKLAPHICTLDADGVNLYLFNDTWKKAANIIAGPIIDDIFMKHVPNGAVALAPVLHAAFADYFTNTRKRRPTSILVLIAGYPRDLRAAADLVVQAANTVTSDTELTVSVLQIGCEKPFAGDIALQCNSRARHKIIDAHTVGYDSALSDCIPLERFMDQYYLMWPGYAQKEAFPIQAERIIIEHHMGGFRFE